MKMMHIALIAPCILPVPATRGGAVENLITRIILDNEKNADLYIDLYTILEGEKDIKRYEHTEIISIDRECSVVLDHVLDKYYRTIKKKSASRTLDIKIIKAFENRIAQEQIEYDAVVVENMMSTAVMLTKLCRGRYSFPVYFHMHNDVDIYRSPEYIRRLVSCGTQFIAVSRYVKDQIRKCTNDALVHVLYNGVLLEDNDRCSTEVSDVFRFLYSGRVIPEKGVKEVVQAFEKVWGNPLASHRKATLDIIGFNKNPSSYEKQVMSMAGQAKGSIKCLEQMSRAEMYSLYRKYDTVVMPTIIEESFGLVALETMAKGVPLITTDSGALPEVVGDGALIVDRGENFITALSEAMLKMATDDSYRKALAERGYRRARSVKDFDISNYYRNFTSIIEPQLSDEDKITVIVPVYNVSAYIERCLISVIEQTYRNLEIILIDDGSTDDSGMICDKFASKDDRIMVIHQVNTGLSGARNTGLDHAVGKYLFFVDSDDYIEKNTLDILLNRMKNDHADIVACGFSKVFDDCFEGSGKEEVFTAAAPGRWSGRESVIQMMRSNNVCSVAWNKLYRKELFDDIRFPLGVQNEDEATIYKLLYKAGIVTYMPDVLYKYYQRNNSLIHGNLDKRYHYFLKASSDRVLFFRKIGDEELEQHSRISLLELIKYSYRNIDDIAIKKKLRNTYKENISIKNAPLVMGIQKAIALFLWKYIRY